jgi:putative methanogenesis marker protein 8
MECLGMTRVVVEDGAVTSVGEPRVKHCPLFKKYRGIDAITPEIVRENIEYRMGAFGMFREGREIRMRDFVTFGVSEILSSALRGGEIDAVVLAADGCGTAVVCDPEVVQGLGGRISGICETSPIASVIEGVGRDRVLDPETAAIDAPAGAGKALSMGFSRIAVTVASASDAEAVRRICGDRAIVVAVHTSGASAEDAERIFDSCDIVTACASEHVRATARERGVMKAGTKVPIFGVTDAGKRLVLAKLGEIGKSPDGWSVADDPPEPLI